MVCSANYHDPASAIFINLRVLILTLASTNSSTSASLI